MHSAEGPTWSRNDVLDEIARAHAKAGEQGFEVYTFTISICDVDLPAFISNGECYIQTPLQGLFDAVTACVSESLRDLEIGISKARSAALALADDERAVPGAWVVVQGMVRDSEVR